jgi:hypothetical protein
MKLAKLAKDFAVLAAWVLALPFFAIAFRVKHYMNRRAAS